MKNAAFFLLSLAVLAPNAFALNPRQHFQLKVGETLKLAFKARPLCGISWKVEESFDTTLLALEDESYLRVEPVDLDLCGGNDKCIEYFVFKALKQGNCEVYITDIQQTQRIKYYIEII